MLRMSVLAIAALAMASCAPPANTNTATNNNSNGNAAPKAAAPSADSLMALEQKAWEAYKNKDGKFFETYLTDNFVEPDGHTKADVVKMISEHKDDVKSFTLSEPHVTSAGADAAVLTYKATIEGTSNGKPAPSPVMVGTLFVRNGSDWKGAWHSETPIVEPKAAPSTATNNNSAAMENKDEAKPKMESDTEKKEMAPASNAGNSSNSMASNSTASNSNSSSAATGDAALTQTLMAIIDRGWNAWKAKDEKVFNEIVASDFAFIDPAGKADLSKAAAIKTWTTDNPCNVSSFTLSDAKSYSLGPDLAVLHLKGDAKGTCGDMKLTPIWQNAVFIKEGGAWKTAYIFENLDKKM